MKRKSLDLHQAVPPMPASFTARMTHTLARLEAPHRRAVRPRSVLALAALLAVLLATAAVAQAIDSGILSRLFPAGTPSEQAQSLLQTNLNTATDAGVALTVDELLFDGRSLNCDWTLSSEREGMTYILTDYRLEGIPEELIESGGSLGTSASSNVGDNALAVLGTSDGFSAAAAQKGFLRANFKEPLSGESTLILTAYAYTSDLTAMSIDTLYPDEELSAKLEGERIIGVHDSEGFATACLSCYPAFAAALDAFPDDMNWDQANLDAHEASGLMKSLVKLEICLPLASNAASTQVFGPETFELDTCRVELTSLSFSPALTNAQMRIYPKEAVTEADIFAYRILLADDQGNPWLMNMEGYLITDEQGTSCFEVILDGPPMTEVPASVQLIRVDQRRENEAPMAQYMRLIAEAPEGDRAMMELHR